MIAGDQAIEVDDQQRVLFLTRAHPLNVIIHAVQVGFSGAERHKADAVVQRFTTQLLRQLQHHAKTRRIIVDALQT